MRSTCVLSSRHFLTALLVFCSLTCPPPVGAAGITSPVQLTGEPLDKKELLAVLDTESLTKEELIQVLAARGVSFQLTSFEEQTIRIAGKYLKTGIDDVVKAVSGNFIGAQIRETMVVQRSASGKVDYLGFKADYLGPEGFDFVIRLSSPVGEGPSMKIRPGCEYDLKWGNREFTFGVTEASAEQMVVVLATKVRSATLGLPQNAPSTLPAEVVIRQSPCLTIRMKLVSEGRTVAGGVAPPFYISEPLTVGLLRYYAGKHAQQKTPIPSDAKDADPITQISEADALDIATMLGTRPASYEQLLGAYSVGVITQTGYAELVTGGGQSLLAVQLPANASRPASPVIMTPKDGTGGMAQGVFRIVRIVNPDKRVKTFVERNAQ